MALLVWLVLCALGCLAGGRWYQGYLVDRLRLSAAHLLGTKGTALSAAINRRLALLEGLHTFSEANVVAADFGRRFETYAAGLHAGARDVRIFAVAPGGVIRYLYPVEGNELARDLDLFRDPHTRADALRTLKTRGITLSDPYELRQGGLGMVARKSVYDRGRFWGLATVGLNVPSILSEARLDEESRFALALRDHSGRTFYGASATFSAAPVRLDVELPEGHWELAAVPKGGWQAAVRNDLLWFQAGVALAALCLAGIVSLVYERQCRLGAAVAQRTAALEESEEYNRALFELSPTGLALCRMDGRLVDVNQAFAGMLGLDVEEVLGHSYWEYTPQRYHDQEREQLDRLEKAGRYGPYEKELIGKSGQVQVRLQGRLVEHNGERFIWSSIEDVTDQKKVQADLRREHRFSEGLIDSLPGVFYLYDENLKFLRWNKNLERVLGYTHEEIAALSPLDLFADDERELLQTKIRDVFSRGASHVEAYFCTKEGERIPYFFTGLKTEIDECSCLIGIGIDISARKELERELTEMNATLETRVAERTRQLQESRVELECLVEDLKEKSDQLAAANEKLQEVDRLKSMFIASMSHELRTPLNSVIGYSSIIVNEWLGPLLPLQKENLAIVLRAGKHLLSLINDVIDVSKIEAGQIEVRPEEFDLFDLVTEAVQQLEPDIRRKGLELRVVNVHQVLMSDRRRLLQATLNILSNAMKYTEAGSIELAVLPGEGWVEVAVSDTGIGISEQEAALIFQPFQRLDSALRGTVSGTGLGLYLTAKLVTEVLRGSIRFTSKPGSGSTFTIHVPLKAGAEPAPEGA
ncbi:PAS domain S-box protein [Geomonas silvestris]|uniref:PAS domain S-box protein n=1 Tax=Geomonas silvestris TaxID=2740184 RepID=UPI001616FFB9|nr:PAS domain S-box protein [Geomonas silvestris]